jgi:hypothetical protein
MSDHSTEKYKELLSLIKNWEDKEDIVSINSNINKINENISEKPVTKISNLNVLQNIIKDYVISMCEDINDDTTMEEIVQLVSNNIGMTSEFKFESSFLNRIPTGISKEERVLLLCLYYLHNTQF